MTVFKSSVIVAEPAASYLVAPPLVVDCSLLCAVLFNEDEQAEAEARLAGRTLHAPTLIDYEMTSVALKKTKHATAQLSEDALLRYAQVPLQLHAVDPAQVHALAHRYAISAYDASYLWLAGELKSPLATFDRKLGQAAQAHLATL